MFFEKLFEGDPQQIKLMCKRLDTKGAIQFFEAIDYAYKNGYEIVLEGGRAFLPVMGSYPRVILQKVTEAHTETDTAIDDEVQDEPKTETQDVQDTDDKAVLESLTKKKELLDFAESKGIVVPEEFKQPAAIKKFIESNI